MLKKILVIMLCISVVLSACSTKTNHESEHNSQKEQPDQSTETIGEVPDEAIKTTKGTNNSLNWELPGDVENVEVLYVPSDYENKVPDYSVAEDLSNIKNIHRFSGFTDNQKKMLSTNGFVVMPVNPETPYLYMKMYDIYENNEYEQIPSFITVDLALHLYHKFYGETLKYVEKTYLNESLSLLTANMQEKALMLLEENKNSAVKDNIRNVLIYFTIANQLSNGTYGQVPDDIREAAEEEIELIEKAAGYLPSPLMGFKINYEQFKVRGHYTEDEVMENYFKTMMWYGLVGFSLEEKDMDHVVEALIMAYAAFWEKDSQNDITLWNQLYSPTDFFVGQSDDITLLQLKDVILSVYGESVTINQFKDETYKEALVEALKALRGPQIKNKLVLGIVDTPTGKQFRFMGQRYTLDANIMQELMFPIIRPVPSGLDVVAAMGSTRAENMAFEYSVPENGKDLYQENLNIMKDQVKNMPQNIWQSNLYNGWLWIIKSYIETEQKDLEGLPYFMKNDAWENKKINTALGSYSELKHDSLLYSKQPVAQMGGPLEPPERIPQYVEPDVKAYDQLLWLVEYSSKNLEKRGLLDDHLKNATDQLISLYSLLRTCAVKELNNEPLTEEENERLKYVGAAAEQIDISVSQEYGRQKAAALIADVAGIADIGAFLQIGTEFPNEIYVAVWDQGHVYLARGAVYGYYEFLSHSPLTDEEWHEMLGIQKVESEWGTYEQINPDAMYNNTPPQPPWVDLFKSQEDNQVQITEVEYKLGE